MPTFRSAHATPARALVCVAALLAASIPGCSRSSGVGEDPDRALLQTETRQSEWLMHGRTYGEDRFSPLDQIDASNVRELGLAWSFTTDQNRGHEATPLVVDGVLYVTASWSVVYALDARTGQQRWTWNPQVPPARGALACCDVVNRGVAYHDGRVYVGVLDGRLAALDARTGDVVWEVMTVDERLPYTITGAPRVVKGRVIIGNGGAEYGVRGYVSAYDALTGELAWRVYTVPGDPALPFESPALERAAATWTGEWWTLGGGGTVWDSLAYDPDLDLLYAGTGNGTPWNQAWRSPGGGDNLYLSSILALRPDTGDLVWHYQTTPGESWDFTATQHMILADLTIEGRTRQVLMQAPKNGFFYVLDRATGELISAEPFAEVTWATHIDRETGRPAEVPEARYQQQPVVLKPGPAGAHNWQPMSYSPQAGLVYIPTIDMAFRYEHDPAFAPQDGVWNLGTVGGLSPIQPGATGSLMAWDPVTQQERWRVPHASSRNGGTLATAGDLVFQGTGDGRLAAYRTDTGEALWQAATGAPIVAPPMTYELDGMQYVAVLTGPPPAIGPGTAAGGAANNGRLLVFTLGGDPLPETAATPRPAPAPLPVTAPESEIAAGATAFGANCSQCHGPSAVSAGAIPDLRYSDPAVYEQLDAIVLQGALESEGMPAFDGRLNQADVSAIRVYLLARRAALSAPR